jgi:hypothetical protein
MTHPSLSAVTQASRAVEQAIDALLHPKRLHSAADCLCRPSPIPTSAGVHAWYFDELPPGVPIWEALPPSALWPCCTPTFR